MPYLNFKVRNVSAIICGVPHRSKCQYCGKPSEFLCDFPVGKNKQGKKKTCDRKLCRNCSQKGISQNVDFCREHYPLAKAAYERRQKQTPSLFLQ